MSALDALHWPFDLAGDDLPKPEPMTAEQYQRDAIAEAQADYDEPAEDLG